MACVVVYFYLGFTRFHWTYFCVGYNVIQQGLCYLGGLFNSYKLENSCAYEITRLICFKLLVVFGSLSIFFPKKRVHI